MRISRTESLTRGWSGVSSLPQTLFSNKNVAAEFDRWCGLIGQETTFGRFSLSALEVLRAHFLLADYFQTKKEGIAGVGPRSLHLFHSAVSRQWAGFGGRLKWESLTDVTATLFFGIVRNHCFIDANKRTALLAALYQLRTHGRIPAVSAITIVFRHSFNLLVSFG